MRLQVVRFKCGSCHEWFEATRISELAYGEFLLRSKDGRSVAYLDALRDTVFEEVDGLLLREPRTGRLSDFERADVLHAVFGVACDPDENGDAYQGGTDPACPNCGRRNIEYWEAADPPRYVEAEVPPVTHHNWARLEPQAREKLIRDSISRLGIR